MESLRILLESDMTNSARLTATADVLCLLGAIVCVLSALVHWRAAKQEPTAGSALLHRAPILLTWAALVVMSFAVGWRWIEVNHFPSQTMSEVLTMFTTALLVSMVVLKPALGLSKRGHGWAILEDVLVMSVLVGVWATHAHVRTLSTAQRDLPPALQSYWFAPHLSCLIFSYATMAVAAVMCLVYFVTRFWTGVFRGGWSKTSQWIVLAGLLLVPFAQVVTIPMFVLAGLVFAVLHFSGRMPATDTVKRLETSFEEVSFRAFAVGFPFLTAGLWMGAFWAQAAWANYWGWDSKENSALITWLVYVIYIHMRLLGGYRGEKAMSVLVAGALSVFLTFQIFGYLPDSQKSLHRYTDDGVQPQEGMQGGTPQNQDQARAEPSTR